MFMCQVDGAPDPAQRFLQPQQRQQRRHLFDVSHVLQLLRVVGREVAVLLPQTQIRASPLLLNEMKTVRMYDTIDICM